MNILALIAIVAAALVVCLSVGVRAGGDKSAKTTVITLAGGHDKQSGGYPIPIPIPVCTGRGYSHHHQPQQHHHFGAQSRIGWRR